MKIAGIHKTSLIEYPSKLSCVLFTQGCNFRCPYCHNPELVIPERFGPLLGMDDLLSFLVDRRRYLGGVVITGGEPCLQPELPEFISEIKDMGYSVKLDTNGAFPGILRELLQKKHVDYVAMDIKSPLAKYRQATDTEQDTGTIKQSIGIIKEFAPAYEFRTTVVSSMLEIDDFKEIGQLVRGAQLFFLQRFIPSETIKLEFAEEKTYSDSEFLQAKKVLLDYVEECFIR